MNRKVSSFFSGIGGLDFGFSQHGNDVVYANEFHSNTALSYQKIHDLKVDTCDVNLLHFEDIPDSDIIIGGPPCQSFSLLGKRKENDPRGACVFRYFDIIKEKSPDGFVMENVPGINSSKIGKRRLVDFLTDGFENLGYNVVNLKFRAIDYGVPQKRVRSVIIGSKNKLPELPDRDVFFEELGVSQKEYDISAKAAIGDLGSAVEKGQMSRYKESCEYSVFSQLMREKGVIEVSLHELPRMSDRDTMFVDNIPPGGNYTNIPDEISTPRIMKFKKQGGRTTTYGRLHPDRPSYTINTAFRRPRVKKR